MTLIRTHEAAKLIDRAYGTLLTGKKYKKFLHKDGFHSMFDIDGYRKEESRKKSITAEVKLLIPYLLHIKGLTVTEIVKGVKITREAVYIDSFGYEGSKKIKDNIEKNNPEWIIDFNEYYR